MTLIGQSAPDFWLPDHDGKPVGLKPLLQEGPIMLVFYPGDFQPVCKKQLCSYQEAYERFQKYGIRPVGISSNSPQEHLAFKREYKIEFPLLSDPKRDIFKLYQVTSLFMLGGTSRAVFIIGRNGNILYRYVEPTTITHRKPTELLEVIDELKIRQMI